MSGVCVICGTAAVVPFLDRRGVPVHQNLLRRSVAQAREVKRGDLTLVTCRECGFIGNTSFREELTEYREDYDNDQNWSPRFNAHVDALVKRLVAGGLRDQLIVEVGCGKGTFLRRLCELGDNRGIGFDTAYNGPLTVDDGRVTFVREIYGAGQRHLAPDAVVCRHVIEHVPRPLELLGAVKSALDRPARLYFETPDVGWILDGLVIHDFFYEHCSYFTPSSLVEAFLRSGFVDPHVERVFGDQYLWLEALYDPTRKPTVAPSVSGARVYEDMLRYRGEEQRRLSRIGGELEEMRARGRIAIWGAGAKGVTFLNLLDPYVRLIDCVVDINPRKQGLFLPGTAHPIVGPDQLAARAIANVVVMNGNYLDEIRVDIARAGLDARIYNEADL